MSLVPAHKLEEYIQANLKPSEECLKQIDQAADAICVFLRSNGIPVETVAKVRPRVGDKGSGSEESSLSPRWWC